MLVRACEVVRVENALVGRGWSGRSSSSCRTSWGALEKHFILVVGCFLGLDLACGAGLGSLGSFGCGWGVVLRGSGLDFDLVDGEMIFVLAIFASDGISQLLKALGSDAEFLSNRLLRGVVGEEDEGLQGRIRVSLLVDAPQDMIEEGLQVDRHGAFSRLLGTGHLAAVASGAVGRFPRYSHCFLGMHSAVGGLPSSACT